MIRCHIFDEDVWEWEFMCLPWEASTKQEFISSFCNLDMSLFLLPGYGAGGYPNAGRGM